MFARKLIPIFLCAAACVLWAGTKCRAEDSPLAEMEPDVAKEFGAKLTELLAKTYKDLPVKVDPDAEKAVGLLNPNAHQGIILVPLKGFREDRDTKDSEKDRGVGLCYIFMSPEFNPLVDGKPATDKQLRKLKFKPKTKNATLPAWSAALSTPRETIGSCTCIAAATSPCRSRRSKRLPTRPRPISRSRSKTSRTTRRRW